MFKKMVGGLGAGVTAFGRALPVIVRDLAGLTAVGMIAYGAWLIVPAAGFIVGGALVLTGVMLISAKAG